MLTKQPNSRMCFACGLENPFGLHLHFYDNSQDEVYADFTIAPEHQGYPGVVHGGVTAAILDECAGLPTLYRCRSKASQCRKLILRKRILSPDATYLAR